MTEANPQILIGTGNPADDADAKNAAPNALWLDQDALNAAVYVKRNIGDVFISAVPSPPKSIPWVGGASIDGNKYPELLKLPLFANGKIPGQGGNDYFRVASAAIPSGVVQGDAIRNITGNFGNPTVFAAGVAGYGAFSGSDSPGTLTINDTGGTWGNQLIIYFSASHSVPTSTENRPNTTSMPFWIYTGKDA